MKIGRVVAGLMGMAMALVLSVEIGAAQTIKVGKDNRTLEVSGLGTASAEPEVAKVHVGFINYGASLTEGYKNASDLSSAIIKALNANGATKNDIESQGQGIAALTEFELKNLTGPLKGMKYRVTQSWTVRVNPDQVAKTLDAAVQAGANNSGQVEWLMKDSTVLERQAVARATARARALAEEMASGMGVKLGPVVYVTTDAQPSVIPISGRMSNLVAFAPGAVAPETAPLSIEAQRIERSVTVKAVYAIE